MTDATRPFDTSGRGAGSAVEETMNTEPARIIARVRAVWNAIVLVLAATGFVVSPKLDGAVQDLLQAGITLALIVYGIWTARHQGEVTRDAVYAPETVEHARQDAYKAVRDAAGKR